MHAQTWMELPFELHSLVEQRNATTQLCLSAKKSQKSSSLKTKKKTASGFV
jgi:hypothetical protein